MKRIKIKPKESRRARIEGIKFNRFLVDCMKKRTDDIVENTAVNGRAFRELTQKIILLLNDIKEALPTEHQNLLGELEDVYGKRELITQKTLYRRGLKDGIKICNMFLWLK